MKKEGFGRGYPFEIGDIAQNNNDFEILKKFSVEFYNWLIRSGASTSCSISLSFNFGDSDTICFFNFYWRIMTAMYF